MNLRTLLDHHYEDLNSFVVAIEARAGTTTVNFECDDWENTDRRRTVVLTFADVIESTLVTGPAESLSLLEAHPLLLDHNEAHEDLYFSSAPTDANHVLGSLHLAHTALMGDWRPLARYVQATPTILATGNGLLARGPKPLIRAYQNALSGLVESNLLSEIRQPAERWQVFLFDDLYLVCRHVAAA